MDKSILCEDRNGVPIRRGDIVVKIDTQTYSGSPLLQCFKAIEMRDKDVLWVLEFPGIIGEEHGRCVGTGAIAKWGKWVPYEGKESQFHKDARMILTEMRGLGADV